MTARVPDGDRPAARNVEPMAEREILAAIDAAAGGGGADTAQGPPAPESLAAGASRAARLEDFLDRDGENFISFAYLTILRRHPDFEGRLHMRSVLASGGSKIGLIGGLRYSAEGRRSAVAVAGLWRRWQIHRVLVRLRGGGRQQRAMLAAVAASVADLQAEIARLAAQAEASRTRAAEQDLKAEHERAAGGARFDRLALAIADVAARAADEQWIDPVAALAETAQMQAEQVEAVDRETGSRLAALEAALGGVSDLGAALAAIQADTGWRIEGASVASGLTELLQDQSRRVRRAEALAERGRQDLVEQQRRLGLVLSELRRSPSPAGSPVLEAEEDRMLDALYVSFEDRFRGTREDIKARQAYYLPQLRAAGAGREDAPIVDVGSGRGEWLELLREHDMAATGVDTNSAMVERCAELELDCVHDDALAYLARLPDASIGAVTGFHIIEHLPFRVFVKLLDEALRTLKPGGVILFETPNPANLLVASRWFYLDPTHRNPIPGEMAAMIAEARGFADVSIQELHPMLVSFPAKDAELGRALDRIFHGPQDFALTARRP